MSDLISRSELIKLINNKYIGLNDATDLYHGGKFDCFKEIKLMIKEQPTAYDPDKVVKQLEEKVELARNRYIDCTPNDPNILRYRTQYTERKMCLEIVKGGGLDE